MTKVVQVSKAFADAALYVKKALVAAASVLVAIQAVDGVPANGKEVIRNVLAGLATFGITYRVTNVERP